MRDTQEGPMPHTCHWPGCTIQVPPPLWGCKAHWFRLPGLIRAGIHATYRPGQEIDKKPSAEYRQAARRAREFAEEWERNQRENAD